MIEAGLTVIDAVSTAQTFSDPNASLKEKAVSAGLFLFGLLDGHHMLQPTRTPNELTSYGAIDLPKRLLRSSGVWLAQELDNYPETLTSDLFRKDNQLTKQEFQHLFEAALELAAKNAEQKLGRAVPRHFRVRYGRPTGSTIDEAMALDKLYLGPDEFYLIIDVAVVEVTKDETIVFVRPSNHRPGPFEQTWNNPPGSGPFKQLLAETIRTEE